MQPSLNVYLQVINPRTIRPLDRATLRKSVSKTHRLVVVEEGWPQNGLAAEICALAMEDFFDELDAPIVRITGADIPMPYAASLEVKATPQVEDIVKIVARSLGK